jgi:glycerol-3-phosphate dehydrogenase
MLQEAGAPVTEADPGFNPNRAPLIVPKVGYRGLKMSRTEFFKVKDPTENVVCKCERVTEQEVIDAVHRSLPIDSTQAIRKRTRAGMGHCQGDPENYDCETRVAMIIARETGLSLDQVARRPWPASSMMHKRVLDDDDSDRLRALSNPKIEYELKGAAT